MSFTVSPAALVLRPASQKPVDASAVRAVAQAAINVELFTIPLYMGALYSIVGTHQITSPGNAFYQGRLWPGLGPTANRLFGVHRGDAAPADRRQCRQRNPGPP